MKEAATQSQNRGLAAGPKGEKCGNREWVTEDQIRIFEYIKKEPENAIIKSDFTEEVAAIREKYSNKESTRGLVWLSQKVKQDNFNFDRWLSEVSTLTPAESSNEAVEIQETYISDTTYANAVYSGIAGWFDRYPRIPYG
ncbi:MAG: hypothetical protein ACK55I_15855, partial [bacterium]